MRNCQEECVPTQDLAPTPATQEGHEPGVPVPDGALISDDKDDSLSPMQIQIQREISVVTMLLMMMVLR